jgi:cytochrome P450
MMNRSRSIVFFQFAVQYGLMPVLNMITPKYVAEARRKHLALTAAKVEARLKAKNPGKDFMSYILSNEAEKLSNLDLVLLASTFIVAGSNTSADAMTGLTYLLLRNPEKLEKLKQEIRSTFKSKEDITVLATARCKYLTACIEEGLRLYPPTPCNLPRVVPGKGEVIDGKWVPGGMAVSVHVLSAGHSERNFTRATDFVPERWMELPPGSEFEGDDKGGIQPFSYGPRNCAGKT